MKKIGTTTLGIVAAALSTTACATVRPSAVSLLSPTMTIVAGVGMIDPMAVPAVTYDAIQLEPEHAGLIAAFAVASAPDYANTIVTAATNGAPERAAEIDAAVKRALSQRPVPRMARIPDHGALVQLVERATAAGQQ